jgi:hypothetical protein
MKEKFPITKNIITALNVVAVLILVIGGISTIGSFSDKTTEGITLSILILFGTIVSAIIPAFLAELLKIVLEIERNTRKD